MTEHKAAAARAAEGNPAAPAIDAIDMRMIALLRGDGRIASREMAEALGISEATVRARLRRLEEADTLRVVAVTDFRAAGFDLLTSVGVQVEEGAATAVAAELARIPEVLNVHIVAGPPDIEISLAARNRAELARLLGERLLQIPGILRVEAGVALDVLKLQWGWVPFLQPMQKELQREEPELTRVGSDELDHRIVALLSQDARTSNRELARRLDVTEGTIRARLKRLQGEGMIRITAISNAHRLGHANVAFLWIDVERGDQLRSVAAALAGLTRIYYVATMLGRCDVLAVTLVESGEQLTDFIAAAVAPIAGVARVRQTLSRQFVKHDYRWMMILPETDLG